MEIFTVAVLVVTITLVIRRFIFSPHFSERARNQFILDTFKSRSFEELTSDHREVYEFEGRKATAHWIVHRLSEFPSEYIIEFDVHPSTFRMLTISRSTFLRIKDRNDFEAAKKQITTTGAYSAYEISEESLSSSSLQSGRQR